ncbi:MAG: carbon-nitrogen hydrolase family protein, partial [Candidatus Aminicenantes bacterium]|nr:carbon-nitrogen hydrolase family protein [Candidatus Aminicenantes bacterium]
LFLILFLIPVMWTTSCQDNPVSGSDRSREAFIVLPDTEYGPLIYVALVQLEMLVPQNPKQHISDALAAIDAAGRKGVDLIVLPEGINIGSGGKIPYHQAAEPVDSPLLLQIAAKSKKYNCFIVFPFIERDGDRVYNSAVLFDRNGDQLGVYRKMHEPQCVVLKEKVSLGQNLTVFDIDIGRIGILICYDTITPEPALIYGLQGVDLIVYPHMIQPLDNDYFSITTRARAIDSSLYIAAAGWARPFEPAGGELAATCLVDWEGKILAQGSKPILGSSTRR